MVTGPVTLALALLLADAGPSDANYMPQGQFKIPITVRPERRNEIRELLLYVSRDKGQTWAVEGRATPDKDGFPFYAASDGSYWFSVAIIDKQGRQDPVDIYQSPVGQRVVVDTRKPEIRITRAERRGDDVTVQWDIREDNPNLATLRVEYRNADPSGMSWMAVPAQQVLQGETTFRVAGSGVVQVRVQMHDLADNVGQGGVDVSTSAGYAAPATPDPVGNVPPPPVLGDPNVQSQAPPPVGAAVNDYRPSEPAVRPQYRAPEDTMPVRQQPIPAPPPPQPLAQSDAARYPIQQASGSSPNRDWAATSSATQFSTSGMRGGLAAVELVNKKQAKIDFQIGKYGASGLGAVDVYVTTDDGANWTLSPSDRNVTLPSLTEMRGGTPVSGSVMVELQQEGVVHGYYIVVKSRAGRGIKPPESGTPPQVRIEMDITPPSVELYVPQPDASRRDNLLLTWRATDKNLANNCVTLEWAERKDGQWNVIGTPDMANSGQFSWQVPANAPPSVFLRLAARDTAGNVAVAQTQEPVLVDLSVPEALSFKVAK
jgi:hypothetical protein